MKYLLLSVLLIFPSVFFATSPGKVRVISSSMVSSVQSAPLTIDVRPLSRDFLPVISPGQTASVRRPGFKERLMFKVLKLKLKKYGPGDPIDPKKRELGKLSLYFGIGAFAVLFIPIIGSLAFPAALTAIILGIVSLKGNSNVNGIIGICLGSLFYIAIAALIAALILAL